MVWPKTWGGRAEGVEVGTGLEVSLHAGKK